MKYIRRKDTIYEIDKDISFGGKEIYKVRNHDFSIIGNNLPKADSIEDLCDGFLFKDTEANKLHFLDKNDGISLLGAALFKETVRGYIETEEGLKYVAKMNDKGELELL